MRIAMFLIAIVCVVIGLPGLLVATVVTHQIFAGVLLLIAAVLLSGAAIIEAVNRVEKTLSPENAGKQMRVGEDGQLEPIATHRPCALCLSSIPIEASVCRQCGRDQPA